MSLVADYSSENDSDSDDDNNYQNNLTRSKKRELTPLPSASSLLCGKSGEVFNNIYKKAEEMKIASLEKHCKMVDNENHIKEKNGKKICWNYRKGRCRFGNKCTFAHDSDLHDTTINSKDSNKSQNQDIPILQKPANRNCSSSTNLLITNINNTTTRLTSPPTIITTNIGGTGGGSKRTHSTGYNESDIPSPQHSNKKLMKNQQKIQRNS